MNLLTKIFLKHKGEPMNSKMLALSFTICMALAPTSLAYGSAAEIMKKMEQIVKAKSKKAIDKGMCENFAGLWRGTCTSSDENSSEDWIKIYQSDCNYFEISGDGYSDYFETGAVERLGSTNFDIMSDFQATAITQWDIARKVLTVNGHGAYKSLGLGDYGTIDFKTSFELAGGQLLKRFVQKAVSSTSPYQDLITRECLYSK